MKGSEYGVEVREAKLKVQSRLPFTQRESFLSIYKDEVSPATLLKTSTPLTGMKVERSS